ncbi:MAG: methylenetetrahydrofolate reductase [Rhizobiaceae bacterium]|nr:methylenetetrahydrofolate reductase [Rhizobiaceae bacterium]
MNQLQRMSVPADPLAALLDDYSIEITARDTDAVRSLAGTLPPGAEVFIANLPKDGPEVLVQAARAVREAGFEPVPHIVARNIASAAQLEEMMAGLAKTAGVRTVLALGGDRDDAIGPFDQALQVIETGVFQKNGVERIRIACYPEGHPRIPDHALARALGEKLTASRKAGLDVTLVGQFLFDPVQIVRFARMLRSLGIEAPLRVGVAGPAERTKLIKYALRCGVGASLRALRERSELARNVMSGETPEALLEEVAAADVAEPELGMSGVHFFTFGDPAASVRWAEARRLRNSAPD